jgi:Notch-like protein
MKPMLVNIAFSYKWLTARIRYSCFDLVLKVSCLMFIFSSKGKHCQYNISTCHSSICKNNGTCQIVNSKRRCSCTPGWTGADCTNDVDECQASPCKRGSCHNIPGSFYCACPVGFTGVHCDVDFNECFSMPCDNGGTCSDQVNGFVCTCAPGYTGVNCKSLVTDCSSKPCQNGGTCSTSSNRFTCSCQAGFTGLTCGVNIDECSSRPCKNGGTCIDKVNSFQCQCADGFRGQICESLYVISFREGSYIPVWFQALSVPAHVTFRFRTSLPEGLLLYQGGVSY